MNKIWTVPSHRSRRQKCDENVLFSCFTFTGKERDEETGYSYHGARYYDPSLSGIWLSVDPMADKYTSISPYAYCAWNPVKLFDPNGLDTFNYDLQSGNLISYKLEQEGKHCVNLYVGDDLVGSCGDLDGLIYADRASWNVNEVQGKTDYLIFTDGKSGKKVFDMISHLAINDDSRSLVEWDYYLLKDGTGELSTSHQSDKMVHAEDTYIEKKASSWDHYHPFINSYSWFPSYSDQENARDLQNGNYGSVPCTIHTCGFSQRFDKTVYYRNHNPSELKKYFNPTYTSGPVR